MRTAHATLTLLLALGPLAACREGIAPVDGGRSPDVSFAAEQSKGTGLFVSSGTGNFLSCVGEVVQSSVSIPYAYHTTTTPSGQTIYTDHFLHEGATGTLLGLSTGRVWTLARTTSPGVIRVGAGELSQVTVNTWWEREGGPDVNFHANVHFSQNANGVITVDRSQVFCKAH